MAYKILEANGVDNENVDGGALNRFIARNKSGIVGRVLSECALTATGSQIGISPGLLMICGIRVKITEIETLGFSALPVEPIEYQIIAQVTLGSSGAVDFSLFLQLPATLIQEELYVSNHGTYQVELGRFTHATDGSITNLKQTLKTIGEEESVAGSSIVEWDENTVYKEGDIVHWDNVLYICLLDGTKGEIPDSTIGTFWAVLGGSNEKPQGDLSITATFNITEANTTITLQNLVGMTSIDWGDGTEDSNLTHTYTAVGEYTCKIYGVTEIGDRAFFNYGNLTGVTIGDSVEIIGEDSFRHCINIKSLLIGNSVTTIAKQAFYYTKALNSIKIPDSVTFIGNAAFASTGAKHISIGSGIEIMDFEAFAYAYTLETLEVGVINPFLIDSNMLIGCSHIKRIIVPIESLEAYKTAWSDYSTLICSYVTSLESVSKEYAEGTFLAKQNPTTKNFNAAYSVQVYSDGQVVQRLYEISGSAKADTLAVRGVGGTLLVGTPLNGTHATTRDYVDNLPDYLTLTSEQKVKWKTWLESILA